MRDKRIVVPVTKEELEKARAIAKERHFDSLSSYVRFLIREPRMRKAERWPKHEGQEGA